MKVLRIFAWFPAALLFALLCGCHRGPAKLKVAFVTNNPESFWSIAEAGTKKAADEENIEVLFRKPAPGDAATQKEQIDTVLGQGIKALAVSVIDPDNQTAYLNEIAARVPLLTQDNDAPGSKRKCYIGTDNYGAGKTAGALIQELMPKGGIVVLFVGDLKSLNAQKRRQGVLDQLAGSKDAKGEKGDDGDKYGKYLVYRTYLDQPEGPQKAKENTVDAIIKLGNRKEPICMVGLWAYNPPAILSAVKDKGKEGKIHIVAFDEDTATLQGIADGGIYATVVQQPFQFGYQAVKIMAALARGDDSKIPKGDILYIPHRIVTKDGGKDRVPVEKFRKELDQLLNGS